MNEEITQAAQTANLLVSDIQQAWKKLATLPAPPEGFSPQHKALVAYLDYCLVNARRLESKLLVIVP